MRRSERNIKEEWFVSFGEGQNVLAGPLGECGQGIGKVHFGITQAGARFPALLLGRINEMGGTGQSIILKPSIGRHVPGCGTTEPTVKAHRGWARRDRAGNINVVGRKVSLCVGKRSAVLFLPTEPEVPLADDSGGVSFGPKQGGNRFAIGSYQGRRIPLEYA